MLKSLKVDCLRFVVKTGRWGFEEDVSLKEGGLED